MNHQDHFRCTITCGFCGKRRDHEDDCHIIKREVDKLKRQEAEREKNQTPSNTPKNGDKGGKGGGKGGSKDGSPNHNPQRRLPVPAASPSYHGSSKKRPQGTNASPEESNLEKR